MKLIDFGNTTDDPTHNLAVEEFAVRNLDVDETYLLFYVNEPAIIVGKYQNTREEINERYVADKGIHVVRRISGGGAVYHDLGNLNFSFITRFQPGQVLRFQEFTGPVIAALKDLGVPAELTGRNDIVADGRKISGNAQFTTTRKMFSHGTLLFDSQLDEVSEALRVKPQKIESKGLKSVRSRVANISEFLDSPLTMEQFRQHLVASIVADGDVTPYTLDESQLAEIAELSEKKYRQWHWNYGESPPYNIQKTERFAAGEIDARIFVRDGEIESITFFGDFLSTEDPALLGRQLVGVRYEPQALVEALSKMNIAPYFGELSAAEFAAFLY